MHMTIVVVQTIPIVVHFVLWSCFHFFLRRGFFFVLANYCQFVVRSRIFIALSKKK
jgi:hypothetical protein